MSFVVELDSRLDSEKAADGGSCLYTFDGDGILGGTASVSGHTVTVTCAPLPGWKAAIAGKSSVKMALQCTGVLAAADFSGGEFSEHRRSYQRHSIRRQYRHACHDPLQGLPDQDDRADLLRVLPRKRGRFRRNGRQPQLHLRRSGRGIRKRLRPRRALFRRLEHSSRDGSGTHHVPGSSITVTDHIHLYAQWTRNSSGDDGDTGYTLRLTKLDAGDGTPLSGAKFELWRVGTRSDTRLGVYETNRYGWTQAEVSQSGDYYWVETVPPEGYRLGGGKHPTNTGKNSRITVYNTEAAVPALFTDDHYAYIVGGPDGTVRPNDSMTRAGVATIFFRLLKDSVRDANLLTGCTYTDVPDGHWANTAISTMTGLDIVRGYDAAAFGPGDPITRAQFAAICARFDTGKSNGSRTFSDIEGHWAKAYIERAAELGWISGFQDGTFRPDAYITRAQAVTMINRMLNRLPEDPSDLLPGMNVWPDCRPGDWFYLAIQEATNSHDLQAQGRQLRDLDRPQCEPGLDPVRKLIFCETFLKNDRLYQYRRSFSFFQMEVLLMKRIFALLLAAVSLISLTACAQPEAKTVSKYQLAAPQYPQMAQYPDETKFSRPNGDFDSDGFNQVYDAWQADRRKQTDQPEGYTDALDGYLRAVIPQLLTGSSGENKVCSPINLYMALAMLAEVTDGESREQILALLGQRQCGRPPRRGRRCLERQLLRRRRGDQYSGQLPVAQ